MVSAGEGINVVTSVHVDVGPAVFCDGLVVTFIAPVGSCNVAIAKRPLSRLLQKPDATP